MPPKRNGGKGQLNYSKPSTSTIAMVPLPDLPEHIIIDILKRLPVKSIIRFKCVSKEWLSLLSSPKFISMHHEETSNNPLDHSFIIHSIKKDPYRHEVSLLKFNSTRRGSVSLINPLPFPFEKMELVGSINGLICLTCPSRGDMIILWNPAMNLYKAISLCIPDDETRQISLGFAYDSASDDYKIIQIDFVKPNGSSPEALLSRSAEVYSVNLDSWKRVHIGFPFFLLASRCEVIAKGIPYWRALFYQENGDVLLPILVYYDMRTGSLKHVGLPLSAFRLPMAMRYVEWKGNLGVILFFPSRGVDTPADILVYDEMRTCWKKISSHGPTGLKMKRFIQCSRNGGILAETPRGKLMLYDPVSDGIKKFSIPGALELSCEAFAYTESLITVKGMEQVKEKKTKKSLEFFLKGAGRSCGSCLFSFSAVFGIFLFLLLLG